MPNNKLTEKQKLFVDEYLVDLNATRAYKAAYPTVKKEETAAQAGSRLLRNVKVKEYLDKRMKDREIRTEITQDKVLQELAAIAFANGTDFAKITKKTFDNEDGVASECNVMEPIPTAELPANKRKAIACISNTKYGVKIDQCDKVKALELLGKHLGMFKDKVEVTGAISNPYAGLTTEELQKLADEDDG